jgi:hypothetical protein
MKTEKARHIDYWEQTASDDIQRNFPQTETEGTVAVRQFKLLSVISAERAAAPSAAGRTAWFGNSAYSADVAAASLILYDNESNSASPAGIDSGKNASSSGSAVTDGGAQVLPYGGALLHASAADAGETPAPGDAAVFGGAGKDGSQLVSHGAVVSAALIPGPQNMHAGQVYAETSGGRQFISDNGPTASYFLAMDESYGSQVYDGGRILFDNDEARDHSGDDYEIISLAELPAADTASVTAASVREFDFYTSCHNPTDNKISAQDGFSPVQDSPAARLDVSISTAIADVSAPTEDFHHLVAALLAAEQQNAGQKIAYSGGRLAALISLNNSCEMWDEEAFAFVAEVLDDDKFRQTLSQKDRETVLAAAEETLGKKFGVFGDFYRKIRLGVSRLLTGLVMAGGFVSCFLRDKPPEKDAGGVCGFPKRPDNEPSKQEGACISTFYAGVRLSASNLGWGLPPPKLAAN